MLDLRDSKNSNWIKNVTQQDEGEDIEKSSPLLSLQEWLDKATSKQDLAMEARRKGLIPQSGDWLKPRKWLVDPKLHALVYDKPDDSKGWDWGAGDTRGKNRGTRGLEESPSSRKRLDEGEFPYSKPSKSERRLREKLVGEIFSEKDMYHGYGSEGWNEEGSLTVSEKKAFLEEVTNTLLKFVPSTHLRAVKSISIKEKLSLPLLASDHDQNALAMFRSGRISIRGTKKWADPKEEDYSQMGQVVLHEIGHAIHYAWSVKFKERLIEEIDILREDPNTDRFDATVRQLEELLFDLTRLGPPKHKMTEFYLGEYHNEFVKEFNRAKRMEAGFTSEYSKTSLPEFFAETYAVYLLSPESLKQRNPAIYKLMNFILSSFDNDAPITQDNVWEHRDLKKHLEEDEQYLTIFDPAGVGDFEEGLPDLPEEEGEEESIAMLNEWLDKQSHNNLRPMNPPSRPPNKGAVWNSHTHRWSKSGEADLGKQTAFGDAGGVSSIAEAKRKGLVPQSGDWDAPDRWVKPKDDVEESDEDKEKGDVEESAEDGDKKAKEMTQPKGAIAQTLKKFNDTVEKILKTVDDLVSGRVDNPKQTFEDIEKLKGQVDEEIEGAKNKIEENGDKVKELTELDKIDAETAERADKELESLRKHYETQEKEINEKWDENYEDLKKKLSLEESGDYEPDDEQPKPEEEETEEEQPVDEEETEETEETEEDDEDDEEETEEEKQQSRIEGGESQLARSRKALQEHQTEYDESQSTNDTHREALKKNVSAGKALSEERKGLKADYDSGIKNFTMLKKLEDAGTLTDEGQENLHKVRSELTTISNKIKSIDIQGGELKHKSTGLKNQIKDGEQKQKRLDSIMNTHKTHIERATKQITDAGGTPSESEGVEEDDDIFAQARALEAEEDDYDIDADWDEEAAGMPQAQWAAQAQADAENSWAKDTGWGSDVDSEADDFHENFSPEGEQKNSLGLAHEVREYAKTHQTEDTPLINERGEPHDDIYDHHGLGDEEPVTLQHIKDYMESKGTSPPNADWEGGEESPESDEDEPTVTSNAQNLLDRATDSTTELKSSRKEIEDRQKSLEQELQDVGDDEESRKGITDQLTNVKNRLDSINTSIASQTRKTEMANVLLNKKPSLNGEEKPASESDSSSSKNRNRLKMMNEKGMVSDEDYQEMVDLLDIKDING